MDLSARVSDIDHADAILVLDTELVDEAPILDLRVRKAVRRNRARLVVASSRPSTLDPAATAALRFAPGAAEAALVALASALGSDRAGGTSLDELATRAGATAGFIPGRPQLNGGGPPSPDDAVRAAAEVLRDAGDVVVICGERVLGGQRGAQAGEALLAVVGGLGIAEKPESGMIAIPAETNGRGLREVGCSPALGAGPGGRRGRGRSRSARGALLLLETDAPEPELARAASVIAFARFHDDALDEHADVVFPAEIYSGEGGHRHAPGRAPAARAPGARPPRRGAPRLERARRAVRAARRGHRRAVLADGHRAGRGGRAVLRRPHARRDRWPRRALAGPRRGVGAPAAPSCRASRSPSRPRRMTGWCSRRAPTLWTGPEVEYSPSLRFLAPEPRAWLSVADARRHAIESGDEIELALNGDQVNAVAVVRTSVPEGSVFLRLPWVWRGRWRSVHGRRPLSPDGHAGSRAPPS